MYSQKQLAEVCEIKGGFAFKSSEFKKSGIPLIRISNIQNEKIIFNESTVYLSKEKLNSQKDFIIEKGDVLIALSGATTGKYGVYLHDFPSLLNQRVAVIKSGQSNFLSTNYLYHYLNNISNQILKSAYGVAIPNISPNDIGQIQIPLPPLHIQKKIAEVLDKADAIRQRNRQILEKYDQLAESLFLEMFGDPLANPKGWEKKPLKDCINKVSNIKKGFSNEKISYVDISSIDNKKNVILQTTEYELDKRPSRAQQLLNKGDILFSTVRPNLKNIAINEIEGNIGSTGFFVIRVKDFLKKEYIFELLKLKTVTDFFTGITAGANYPALKSSDISNFLIPIPNMDLQIKFSESMEKIDGAKKNLKSQIRNSEDLFGSLLQKAFKGELYPE